MTAPRKFILFVVFALSFFGLGWLSQNALLQVVMPDLAELGNVSLKGMDHALRQHVWTSLSFALWGVALAWGIALCFSGKTPNRALSFQLTAGLVGVSTVIGALCLVFKRWNTQELVGMSFVPDFQLSLAQLSIYQVGMAAAAGALVFGIVLAFSRKPRQQSTHGAAPSF